MAQQYNRELNDVLIRLYRSLLQYAGEAWPWSDVLAGAPERIAVDELAAEQRREVDAIAEVLGERRWPIDAGNYPSQYGDLHYVALEHLLQEIIRDEEDLIDFIQEVAEKCGTSSPERRLLQEILQAERGHLRRLRELADGANASASAKVPVGV